MSAGWEQRRRSVRLKNYDYASPGAYFVTICTWQLESLFGTIADGAMQLGDLGKIVAEEWRRTAVIRKEIRLDEWVVMPNHLHGVVWIADNRAENDERDDGQAGAQSIEAYSAEAQGPGAHGRAPLHRKPRSLGSLVAGFKSAATTRSNAWRGSPGAPLWQRNYYEHIVRNEQELAAIRCYIQNNPLKWALDRDNPANPRRWPLATTGADYLRELDISGAQR